MSTLEKREDDNSGRMAPFPGRRLKTLSRTRQGPPPPHTSIDTNLHKFTWNNRTGYYGRGWKVPGIGDTFLDRPCIHYNT